MVEFQADGYLTLLRRKDISSTSQLLWSTLTHQSVTHQGEHEQLLPTLHQQSNLLTLCSCIAAGKMPMASSASPRHLFTPPGEQWSL